MSPVIERESMLEHLKGYRSYLQGVRRKLDGADSDYQELQGAIKAVNNLIREIKAGQV